MIPYYLKNHLIKIKEKEDVTTAILSSTTGNTKLEIYYYGELMENGKVPLIIDSDYPCLIVAKDPKTQEEFVIFDGSIHGYDAMFCNEIKYDLKRELKKYEFFSGEIEITLGYAIDYDDEIEEYEFNQDGLVKLSYGFIEWNKAKSIGYDWLNLKFKKGKREFVELELA